MAAAGCVVVGAGIVGLATAFHLAKQGVKNVVVLERLPSPMSFTSARSTECYRNFFDTQTMVAFMNRSIDGLEDHAIQSENMFRMSRRGYVFLSEQLETAESYLKAAEAASQAGAGPVRVHSSQSLSTYQPHITYNEPERLPPISDWLSDRGFDLLQGSELIHQHFPYVSPSVKSLLHARRCGWVNSHLLGTFFRESAAAAGVTFIRGELTGARWNQSNSRKSIQAIQAITPDHGPIEIPTPCVVNAAGPYLQQVFQRLVPTELNRDQPTLPVFNELHAKISFKVPPIHTTEVFNDSKESWRSKSISDQLALHAPMLIWSDSIKLTWKNGDGDNETGELSDSDSPLFKQPQLLSQLRQPLPGGVHFRPYGDKLLALWEFVHLGSAVTEPPSSNPEDLFEPLYPEIVQRGLSHIIPVLSQTIGKVRYYMDGGYYLKCTDNLPLLGPVDDDRWPGLFIAGALGGQGIMGAEAAGDLVARHVALFMSTSSSSSLALLPDYAAALRPTRFLSASSSSSSSSSSSYSRPRHDYKNISGQL